MGIHSARQQLKNHTIHDLPLRVAFYARVSSESDEQLNFLGNQIFYYRDYIGCDPAWTFVEGYIDVSLSAAITKKWGEFPPHGRGRREGSVRSSDYQGDHLLCPKHSGLHPVHPPAAGSQGGGVLPERQYQHPGRGWRATAYHHVGHRLMLAFGDASQDAVEGVCLNFRAMFEFFRWTLVDTDIIAGCGCNCAADIEKTDFPQLAYELGKRVGTEASGGQNA